MRTAKIMRLNLAIAMLAMASLGATVITVASVQAADNERAAITEGPDAVLGQWWFPKKNGKMEVYREGDMYFGKVIEYEKPGQLDEKNPDPALKTRPFVGVVMLNDFRYDSQKQNWVDGTIYDGDNGKTYKCRMWFEDGNFERLHARGFIGVSILGRTEIFTRVAPEDELTPAEE